MLALPAATCGLLGTRGGSTFLVIGLHELFIFTTRLVLKLPMKIGNLLCVTLVVEASYEKWKSSLCYCVQMGSVRSVRSTLVVSVFVKVMVEYATRRMPPARVMVMVEVRRRG